MCLPMSLHNDFGQAADMQKPAQHQAMAAAYGKVHRLDKFLIYRTESALALDVNPDTLLELPH